MGRVRNLFGFGFKQSCRNFLPSWAALIWRNVEILSDCNRNFAKYKNGVKS